MVHVNESLVRLVFDEMVKYKPSLSKFLIIDDDDDDDDVDVRLLADLIIKSFPWPIGVELRRLFSGSMRELDRGRLDQLFKTVERTVQFLSFVMIIELQEEIMNKKIKVSSEYKAQFAKRFLVLSLGNFTWLIRTIGTIFSDHHVDYYMPEMEKIFNKSLYKSLDFWVPERNEIGHYQINLTDAEIEKRCVEYADRLAEILKSIAFLVNYKLVTIQEIKVLKSRHKEAKFEHLMDILNSSDSEFRSKEAVFDSFSDSRAVLLMRSIKDPSDFLNLSPLIIDTRTETIDSKEKFNLKKDIFLYTKFQNNKIYYVGTEITEKCDLTYLSNYHDLLGEFMQLLKYMEEKEKVA